MKRPVKKLISFLCASAMFCNVPLLPSISSDEVFYIVKQIGNDYHAMLRGTNQSIYINSTLETATGGTQLVVIGDDGEKQLIPLDEGIQGIYPYSTSTMTQYKFLSPTFASYSFNFCDSTYQLIADQQNFIVGTSDGKYALMDGQSNIVSAHYDSLLYLGKGFYAVNFNIPDGDGVGMITADGTVVIAPNKNIESLSLTSDGEKLIIHSVNGAYFADLQGNPISETYADIREGTMSEWGIGFSKGYSEYQGHNSNIYRFKNQEGYYALSFGGTVPQTPYLESYYSDRYSDPNSSEGYSVRIYGLNSDYDTEVCYDLNGNQFSVTPDPESESYPLYKTYYDRDTHSLMKGQDVIFTFPEETSWAYIYQLDDKVYYIAQSSGYFTVYNSNFEIIQPKIEGTASRDMWFYAYTDNGTRYGTFDPENAEQPILVEPVYQTYYRLNDEYWYAMEDNAISFLSNKGEFIRKIEGNYTLNSNYSESVILNGINEDGTPHSIVYDLTTDSIVYEQTGIYDKISDVIDNMMVVTDYDEEDPLLWDRNSTYRQGVVNMDDTEIIPLTDQFRLSLDSSRKRSSSFGTPKYINQ